MNRGHRLVNVVLVVILAAVSCSPVAALNGPDNQAMAGSGRLQDSAPVAQPLAEAENDLTKRQPSAPPQAMADADGLDRNQRVEPDPEPAGTVVAHVEGDNIVAFQQPADDADPVGTFSNPTEFGGPRVFQAIGPAGPAEDGWIEVLLPIRPNGSTGWIRADEVQLTINPYRIEVDASAYQLRVFRHDEVTLSTTVAIGEGDTPTPLGRFYLIELLRPSNQNGPYGPYAYGLSGYSDTLQSFNGGAGVIGIHGTNRPDLLGQNVSHGCIRVANQTIEEMARFLPLGTPVHVFRTDQTGA